MRIPWFVGTCCGWCLQMLCVGRLRSYPPDVRDRGWTDTAATSITSGKHHGLADARSRPPAAPTHTHTNTRSHTDNHIHHKCLQRRSTCQSGTRTASKYSRTLFWSCRRGGAYPPSCKTDTALLCNSDSVWKITQHFKSDKIPRLPWSILQHKWRIKSIYIV